MSSGHVMPIRMYVTVFVALLVGTAITVSVAFLNLGPLNNVVALGIAGIKATIVILFFMHAKYSTRLVKLVIVSGFFWLVILIAFTLADFESRGWLGFPGK
jgi:cytochrome c oxidase subunit 4